MRIFLAVAAVALSVCLAVVGATPLGQQRDEDVVQYHHVSMRMPSKEERALGARPTGGIRSKAGRPRHRLANNINTLIIDGEKAKLGQFPWMLAMFVDSSFFCGASIISADWVLTAAHCVDGASSFSLYAGTLHNKDGTEPSKQRVTSTTSFRHPGYDANFIDNDIGIVKPSQNFVFGEYVQPIRLPSYTMAVDMMVGKKATISGWGLTSDDFFANISPDLMFVEMTINDGSSCYDYYGNAWIPNKICFDTSKDKKSSCSGDSGGPLIVQEDDGNWTEIGLTSFGAAKGCTLGLPVAFTRVASFLDFIEATTGLVARD